MWIKYQDGSTIGEIGSESGKIMVDEEYVDGARITLEQNCHSNIPFAVTVGMYGIMVHTVYASSSQEANKKYKELKLGLEEALNICKHGTDKDLSDWIEMYCDKY